MTLAYRFIREFQCLGDTCEDTCCKGWGMQVDAPHKALYAKEAPELLAALDTGEASCIMRRDPVTDYCVKFDNGLCSIHRDYGTKFLGDACHFFPRINRAFGGQKVMAAALSCPEIARLALLKENAFDLAELEVERLPYSLKDYLPEAATTEGALKVIAALIAMAGDTKLAPEAVMLRLVSLTSSLMRTKPETWPDGIAMLTGMEPFLPAAEANANDVYFLVQTFAGLMHATKKSMRPRLEETFTTMQKALGMGLDAATLDVMLTIGEEGRPAALCARWKQGADKAMAPFLRRWIQAELAMSSFPYAGFGGNPRERVVLLCVRFATLRLALMAHMDANGNPPDDATAIRVVQSLSRFMDHLAEPELSLALYDKAGWLNDSRLRGLIENAGNTSH